MVFISDNKKRLFRTKLYVRFSYYYLRSVIERIIYSQFAPAGAFVIRASECAWEESCERAEDTAFIKRVFWRFVGWRI